MTNYNHEEDFSARGLPAVSNELADTQEGGMSSPFRPVVIMWLGKALINYFFGRGYLRPLDVSRHQHPKGRPFISFTVPCKKSQPQRRRGGRYGRGRGGGRGGWGESLQNHPQIGQLLIGDASNSSPHRGPHQYIHPLPERFPMEFRNTV